MLAPHHWRALGMVGATFGAVTVVVLDHRGYHDEARVLAIGGIIAGGILGAVSYWSEAESELHKDPASLPASQRQKAASGTVAGLYGSHRLRRR